MITAIQKATSRGQITLPAKWRRQFNNLDTYLIEADNSILLVKPIDVETLKYKPLLHSWKKAAGMLKNRKIPNPLAWQRRIRKEWEGSFNS